jgi:hypothetical protein
MPVFQPFYNMKLKTFKSWHFVATEDIITKFKSQALHAIRMKYINAGGSGSRSGNPPSLIPTLWNKGILFIKRPPGPNNMTASVLLLQVSSHDFEPTFIIFCLN